MLADPRATNEATFPLSKGETVYFSSRYLRGSEFGVPSIPPCPLGSPIGRIIHGCYWMAKYTSTADGESVKLTGPSVVGQFRTVEIREGQSYFINCEHIAGFTLSGRGRLHTILIGIISPTMWSLGYPLPVIVDGPAHIIMYGEGLLNAQISAGVEYIPSQVVAFDATKSFAARALRPDDGIVSHLANAIGNKLRWEFLETTDAYLLPVNRPGKHASRLFLHFLIHVVTMAALVWLLST